MPAVPAQPGVPVDNGHGEGGGRGQKQAGKMEKQQQQQRHGEPGAAPEAPGVPCHTLDPQAQEMTPSSGMGTATRIPQ